MMDPVTVTITTEAEMVGLLRARCFTLAGEITNYAGSDLDTLISDAAATGSDAECLDRMQGLAEYLTAAREALAHAHTME